MHSRPRIILLIVLFVIVAYVFLVANIGCLSACVTAEGRAKSHVYAIQVGYLDPYFKEHRKYPSDVPRDGLLPGEELTYVHTDNSYTLCEHVIRQKSFYGIPLKTDEKKYCESR